jgi:hypothetical protein
MLVMVWQENELRNLPMLQGQPLCKMFEFENFECPLLLRAASIVENLLSNEDFFAETYGKVLNEIGQHYQMADLNHENLGKLWSRLLPLRLIKGTDCKESVYMHCYPKLRQIHIEGDVSAFVTLQILRSLLAHTNLFSGLTG